MKFFECWSPPQAHQGMLSAQYLIMIMIMPVAIPSATCKVYVIIKKKAPLLGNFVHWLIYIPNTMYKSFYNYSQFCVAILQTTYQIAIILICMVMHEITEPPYTIVSGL